MSGFEELTEEEVRQLVEQDDGGVYASDLETELRAKAGLDTWEGE